MHACTCVCVCVFVCMDSADKVIEWRTTTRARKYAYVKALAGFISRIASSDMNNLSSLKQADKTAMLHETVLQVKALMGQGECTSDSHSFAATAVTAAVKSKGKGKQSIAVSYQPQRSGNSHAMWDHAVLPATQQRWHSRCGTWFSDPRGMQGWVGLVGWLHSEVVCPPNDGHLSQY